MKELNSRTKGQLGRNAVWTSRGLGLGIGIDVDVDGNDDDW